MSITYPKTTQIHPKHKVLLVTLGGASASSGRDLVKNLSDSFTKSNNEFYDERVLGVTGYALPGSHDAWGIARRLRTIIQTMRNKSQDQIKIVLVGKSLGGCRLHRVSKIFSRDDFDFGIESFIGVDMSCWPAKHFQRYKTRGQTYQARVFDNNVQHLVNFYQSSDLFQTGHPVLRTGQGFDKNININVNKDDVRIDHNGIIVSSDEPIAPKANHKLSVEPITPKADHKLSVEPIAPKANHKSIDESVPLILGIKRIIKAGVLG